MDTFYRRCTLLACAIAVPSAGAAPALSESEFFRELPVVLSVTRLSQPLTETPASISVIDRALIAASGALTIPDALRLVPGFQVAAASGNELTATYHGYSDQHARRMQVLVDGRSVYNPGFGGVVWNALALTLDDVERIEVIRGPNAAAYGANAFLGTINIITRHPLEDRGTRGTLLLGSNDTERYTLRHAGSVEALDYRLSVQYESTDGFDDRHDGYSSPTLFWRGDMPLEDHGSLTMELGYRAADEQQGFDDVLQPYRERDLVAHNQLIRWQSTAEPSTENKFTFYHNYLRTDDLFDTPNLSLIAGLPPELIPALTGHADGPLTVENSFRVERYDAEFQQNRFLSPSTRVVWGAGARYDKIDAEGFIEGGRASRTQGRLFGNLEWRPVENVTINGGLMYEYYDTNGDFFSPRLGLNWRAGEQHAFRLVASRAYRLPSFFEDDVYFPWSWADDRTDVTFSGQPLVIYDSIESLEAEEIVAFEAGYFGSYFDNRLSLDLKLFHDEISNMIGSRRNVHGYDADTNVYVNEDEVRVHGAEIEADYRPTSDTLFRLAYSYADSDDPAPTFVPKEVEGSIMRVPRHTLSALVSVPLPGGFQGSAAYYHTGQVIWGGEGDDLPDSNRLDLIVDKEFNLGGGTEAKLTFIVKNATNEDYREFRKENLAERTGYIQLRVDF